MIDTSKITCALKTVIHLLVERNFKELDSLCLPSDEPAETMMLWLDKANRTLVMPPDQAFENIAFVRRDGSEELLGNPFPNGFTEHNTCIFEVDSDEWTVDFDVWTAQDGRSDFTLQIGLKERLDGNLDVELVDLHVL